MKSHVYLFCCTHSNMSSCQYSKYGMLILPLTLNEVDYCAIIYSPSKKKKEKERKNQLRYYTSKYQISEPSIQLYWNHSKQLKNGASNNLLHTSCI